MVLPRTRGIRGRGTLLKRKAVRGLSSGFVALICALLTIGLTLDGLSLTVLGEDTFNILSIIGLAAGTTAIIGAIKLWHEGVKLQHYRKPKKTITQKFRIRSFQKKKQKSKKGKKKKKSWFLGRRKKKGR